MSVNILVEQEILQHNKANEKGQQKIQEFLELICSVVEWKQVNLSNSSNRSSKTRVEFLSYKKGQKLAADPFNCYGIAQHFVSISELHSFYSP